MKKSYLKRTIFGIVVASSLFIWDFNHVVMAHTQNMPKSKGYIAMSYKVAGVKMATESEKEAMKIARDVVKNLFKALHDKQYRTAFDYFCPEIQNEIGYDRFVSNLSKTADIGMQYCGVIDYEGNLIGISAKVDEMIRLDNGKLDPRIFEYRFIVNKIQSGWKIVAMTSKDISYK